MPLSDEKFHKKQNQLIERTATALSISNSEAKQVLSIAREQSIRVNTLKTTIKDIVPELSKTTVGIEPTSLTPEGFFVTDNLAVARDSELALLGKIYIQNAASWLPVLALDPQPEETILDVCAAPGGKTSHIAQLTRNQAFITANDNSRPRLIKLQRNLERMGVNYVNFTLHDATRLTQKLEPGSFDKILLDAPCSGEGMMTLGDRKSFESWSVAHIKRLQQLQKKLIVQAWQLLKPGGTLVYSTCTMAPEENEAVVDYLLRHNDDAAVEKLGSIAAKLPNVVNPVITWNEKSYSHELHKALRLKPSPQIEAFFVVKLTKKVIDA